MTSCFLILIAIDYLTYGGIRGTMANSKAEGRAGRAVDMSKSWLLIITLVASSRLTDGMLYQAILLTVLVVQVTLTFTVKKIRDTD